MCATDTDAPPAMTSRGTPCARSWDAEWVERVERREEELDRRICGARTIGHAPCPARSEHPSGRCGHHGGFALTGAPDGNRNAAVHFLYARRLMPCGVHCPAWRSCPLGGGGPDGGRELASRAYPDRPTCPFEQAEYTAVVTDAQRRTRNHSQNAWGLHLAHQVALMTVLVSRAARFLATHPFTDEVQIFHGDQTATTTRPAAALIAYEKLSRELRRWTILLERGYEWVNCDRHTAREHESRQAADFLPDPDSLFTTATGENLVHHRDTEGHREGQATDGRDSRDLRNLRAGPGGAGIPPVHARRQPDPSSIPAQSDHSGAGGARASLTEKDASGLSFPRRRESHPAGNADPPEAPGSVPLPPEPGVNTTRPAPT